MEYFIKFLRTYHCEKVTASFPWRNCHKVSGKPNINYASLVELKVPFWRHKSTIGGHLSSVVLSVPTILRPRLESQAHHLCFFNLYY